MKAFLAHLLLPVLRQAKFVALLEEIAEIVGVLNRFEFQQDRWGRGL